MCEFFNVAVNKCKLMFCTFIFVTVTT